jgi:copper homeostasis protein
VLVEACVDSVESALAAERGGAGRLELCDALFDGGTTPSAGMIAACRDRVTIPVFVIIRPRGGGFVYSDAELDVMRRDVVAARGLGVDGVVIGAMRPDGSVNEEQTRSLVDAAGGLPVTFHRARFAPDLGAALEAGSRRRRDPSSELWGAPTARDGDHARGTCQAGWWPAHRQAGGGVREENVRDIITTTGVREVHAPYAPYARRSAPREGVKVRKALPRTTAWEKRQARIRRFAVAVAGANVRQ